MPAGRRGHRWRAACACEPPVAEGIFSRPKRVLARLGANDGQAATRDLLRDQAVVEIDEMPGLPWLQNNLELRAVCPEPSARLALVHRSIEDVLIGRRL